MAEPIPLLRGRSPRDEPSLAGPPAGAPPFPDAGPAAAAGPGGSYPDAAGTAAMPAIAGSVPRDETLSLISADKVEGTAVYDTGGHRLGAIDTLMIDKARGTVEYAVLSFGGILGFGTQHYPLPWSQLRYDTGLGGYVVALTEAQLREAPSYAPGEPVDLADTTWGERVHSYYGPSLYGGSGNGI